MHTKYIKFIGMVTVGIWSSPWILVNQSHSPLSLHLINVFSVNNGRVSRIASISCYNLSGCPTKNDSYVYFKDYNKISFFSQDS